MVQPRVDRRILWVMGDRLVHGVVALAVLASTGLIGLLLAAPFLPAPAAAVPSPSATPEAAPSSAPGIPPLGLFALRGALSSGPCIALELEPQSYPVAEGAPEGTATVLWWSRGMTGCDTRSGDVTSVAASVTPVADEDEPEGPPVGYAVRFSIPAGADGGGDAPRVSVELTILARQSTQTLIQAVEASSGTGGGLVFDRVDSVDPDLAPIPSQAPAAVGPNGLFVLAGRLGSDGPCLVLELGPESYPTGPEATTGSATIRSWEPASPDPADPAQCLRRAGEVQEVTASVIAVAAADDPNGPPLAFAVSFPLPAPGGEAPQDVEIHIPLATATRDGLEATVIVPDGVEPLSFYRVDSIDPPLGPSPGASTGASPGASAGD